MAEFRRGEEKLVILDFKLLPCSECCMLSSGSPVSELYVPTFQNTVCSIFVGG